VPPQISINLPKTPSTYQSSILLQSHLTACFFFPGWSPRFNSTGPGNQDHFNKFKCFDRKSPVKIPVWNILTAIGNAGHFLLSQLCGKRFPLPRCKPKMSIVSIAPHISISSAIPLAYVIENEAKERHLSLPKSFQKGTTPSTKNREQKASYSRYETSANRVGWAMEENVVCAKNGFNVLFQFFRKH